MSSAAALLLRIVLSLALVLNGAGAHAASLQGMAMAHAMPPGGAQGGTAAEGPCAEHRSTAESGDAGYADRADAAPVHGAHGGDPRDCCESQACACPCVHACASIVATAVQMPFAAGRGNDVKPMVPAHPSPALPHLIRPPIDQAPAGT